MLAERVCEGNWVAIGAAEVRLVGEAGFGRKMMDRSSGRLSGRHMYPRRISGRRKEIESCLR